MEWMTTGHIFHLQSPNLASRVFVVHSSGYCSSETESRIFSAGFEQWPRDTIAHCVSNALSNPVGVVAQLISNVDLSRDCSV